jgi:hypothetical protein
LNANFSGTTTGVTVDSADNSNKLATTAFVKSQTGSGSSTEYATLANLSSEITRATTAEGTKENVSNKSINISTDAASDVMYPSVKAVKTYVDITNTNLTSNQLNATNISSNLTIGHNITTGNISIGAGLITGNLEIANGPTTGVISIGDNVSRTGSVIIGGSNTPITLSNGSNGSSMVYINSGMNSSGWTYINSNTSQSGTIIIGNEIGSNTSTYMYGNTFATKLITNQINASNATSTFSIGNNLTTGTLEIGNISGTGQLNIGTNASRSGQITIGNSTNNVNIGTGSNGVFTVLPRSLFGRVTIAGGVNDSSVSAYVIANSSTQACITCRIGTNGQTANIIRFLNASSVQRGQIQGISTSQVDYQTTSDRRLKTNIVPMQSMIENIMSLKPCKYEWISDNVVGYGFIAQEVFELFPQFKSFPSNSTGGDEPINTETGEPYYYGIDYSRFTPYMIKAFQELKQDYDTKLSQLEARIHALENK